MIRAARRGGGLRRGGTPALVISALLFVSATWRSAPANDRPPLRRAIVPAANPAAWPAGDWERVPAAEIAEFERAYNAGAIPNAAPPLIDRLVFTGTLGDDSIVAGRFEAQVRRLDPDSPFLDLGTVSPAVRALEWSDRPAIWGTAPDGTTLLHVDRDAGTLQGAWSQRVDQVLGDAEFDLRVFPAASIRIELAIPATHELHASRGIVLPPAAGSEPQVWAIELGQQMSCLCTVAPRSDSPPVVTMSVERTAAWSMRPDGGRLQTDFNISIPASSPATLEFVIPEELQNPEVTSTSGVSLPADVDRRSVPPRLVVPLPRLASGRLGVVRVSGDLPLHEGEDWILPEVRLENSAVVSSTRRVHVDLPLRLLSYDPHGVRQSDINVDDAGGDWTFEDTATDARLTVRVGRPAAALVLRAATLLELAASEARFTTAAELLSRGGGEYHAALRFPAGWGIIEVGSPPGDRGAVTSWRAVETDDGLRLQIEFRQSLSSQAPRRVLISGRRMSGATSERDSELFPDLDAPGDAHVWLGVRTDADTPESLTPRGGVTKFSGDASVPEWSRLAAVLGAADGVTWFTHSQSPAEGVIAWGQAPVPETPSTTAPDPRQPGNSLTREVGPFSLDLLLETDVGGSESEWVRHQARYLLSGRRPEEPPRIRMPAGAQFDGLTIDDRPQNLITAGETIELLEWPAAARVVELRYRTRATGQDGWLSRTLDVPLPAWNIAPRTLEWRLDLARTERLSDIQVANSAVQQYQESDWLQRLFGPLARDDWRQTVNPFSAASWRRRLWPEVDAAGNSDGSITICTPTPGESLTVELTDVRDVDRAGWLAVFGAGLSAVLLRLKSRRGTAVLWVAAGLLLIGAGVLPFVVATLCGGALAGVLMGTLLPREWILPARREPEGIAEGSTLLRSGAAIGAGVLLIVVWQSQSQAQPAPAPVPAAAEFDVLHPTDGGVPDDSALIQRRLLPLFEQWQRIRRRNPAYLLQAARYELDVPEAPQLHARFTVAVFERTSRVAVMLPFGRVWVPDPDACRVDGEPAQIRPATSSNALLVEVPGAADDEPGAARITEVEVTLQLSAAAHRGSGWEFDVPPVLDTLLTLPATTAEALTAQSQQASQVDEAGRPVFAIGQRSRIVVQPAAVESSPMGDPITADAVSLIDVHPLRLRVRTQLQLTADSRSGPPEGPQRLRLILPEQADVREVAVAGLRSYTVRHPRRELTLVELELDRFPAPDAAVHLDFTLPVRRPAEDSLIPPLVLLEQYRLQSHRIGLRAAPGMSLDPPATSALPPQLREMPAEMFSAGLGSDTALPIPSHVYLATAPASLPVTARPIAPRKSVALEQSIVVNKDSLHWQATADITVADAPAYRHEFELPSDVQLETVSLVQDEVGRLLDWSHDGNRLMLYLPGDRVGLQQVRLSGTMRFDPENVTSFPTFVLRDAKVTDSDLYVQTTASGRLELLATDGSALPAAPGGGEAGGTVQFSLQDAQLPAAFRALPAPAPLSLTVLTVLDRDQAGWSMLAEILPDRALAHGESIAVELPSGHVQQVRATEGTVVTPQGENEIRVASQAGSEDAAALAFSMPIAVPTDGQWQAPRLKFPGASIADEIVVVHPEFPLAPSATAAKTADPSSWPQKLRAHRIRSELRPMSGVYRWIGDTASFETRGPADGAPELEIQESVLWHDGASDSGGETRFWMIARSSRCDLRFDWPADVQLQRAAWDGREVDAVADTAAELVLQFDGLAPGSVHCLQLKWTATSDTQGVLWRPSWTPDATVGEFAAVLPRDGYVRLGLPGQPLRSDILKSRVEQLLNLAAIAGTGPPATSNRALAGEIDAALEVLGESSPAAAAALRTRWKPQRAKLLETSGGPETAADPLAASLMATAWGDPRVLVMQLGHDAPEIRFWELHSRLTIAAASLAGLLVLTLCLRFRRRIVQMAAKVPVSPEALKLAALGSLWWLWLKLGVAGLLLLGAAAVLQRRSRLALPAEGPASHA